MRSGVELALYNKFCELLMKHNNPKWAVDELDYLVFCKAKDDFWALNVQEQWEVRAYMKALRQLFGE